MILDFGMRNYDLQAVPEYARKVEAIGYGCLWTSEPQHDPLFCRWQQRRPRTLPSSSGPRLLWLPRSPMVIAYTAWDIQKASVGTIQARTRGCVFTPRD
jgi:hypothetical protein